MPDARTKASFAEGTAPANAQIAVAMSLRTSCRFALVGLAACGA